MAGEDSDADAGLSVLMTPSALPDVPSVAALAPANQEPAGRSPAKQKMEDGTGADGAASPSQADNLPQLPAELAEAPPGPVDPLVQVRNLVPASGWPDLIRTSPDTQLDHWKAYSSCNSILLRALTRREPNACCRVVASSTLTPSSRYCVQGHFHLRTCHGGTIKAPLRWCRLV